MKLMHSQGTGKDNKSNWYLYGRHKNGGKLKLVPRNGKSNN